MALVSTIGAANANSYVASVAEVDQYVLDHYVPASVVAKWTTLPTAQKEGSLIRAAQLLDRHVKWLGDVVDDVQALSWPRAFAYDRYGRQIPSSVIPSFLKEFQVETALWVVDQSGIMPQVGNAEFDSIRVGSLEIDFNESGGAKRSLLPESVIAALAPMGNYVANTVGSAKMVNLVRS